MTRGERVFERVAIPAGLGPATVGIGRADITVSGLDDTGLSYEVRVFLNAPTAGPQTPLTDEAGYAGSIHIYGYGLPPPGLDRVGSERRARPRRSIVATEAVRAQAATAGEVSVTLVAVADVDVGVDLDADAISVRID